MPRFKTDHGAVSERQWAFSQNRWRDPAPAKPAKPARKWAVRILIIAGLCIAGAGLYSTNVCVQGVRCTDN